MKIQKREDNKMKTISVLILAVAFYTVDSLSTLDATNTKGKSVFRVVTLRVGVVILLRENLGVKRF